MSTQPDPMPAAEAANRVWSAVISAGETGMRGADIRKTKKLTRGQFENGKAHVRDYRCADENICFVFDGDVYAATKDPGRSAKTMALKMRSIDRQLTRLHRSACAPIADDSSSDAAFRYIKGQLEAMIDNLTIMRESGYSTTSKRIQEAAHVK